MTQPPASRDDARGASATFRAVLPPVHRAATVLFDDVDAMRRHDWRSREAFVYGREGTPTTRELEKQLAETEGARHALVLPSGLAGYSVVALALLQPGELIAMPVNGYGGGGQMADVLLRRLGIEVSVYEPTQPDTWAENIPAGTRLVWIEAPGSITMEVPDLTRLVAHARSVGAHVAIDNTYSAGLHLKPFDLGIDVSLQALTKFQSGASDVTLGSLSCVNEGLLTRLHETRHFLGMGVSADDAYLVLRGLPTMWLRYEQSARSGEQLAAWFRGRPGVQRVLHPAFEECPGHAHWKAHFTAAAGLFSVTLHESVDEARVKAFVEGLRHFPLGMSWGGHSSLALPYAATHNAAQRLRRLGEPVGAIIRFWVGLEPVEALLEDIAQAWGAAMNR
ncbi:PLP-dependent transferase [Piscinibacter terrae]|uniref:Cys/Met metabolism pyridoxal-phosphate-dependent enzyme n=1 Tax=Piscinibacter terrae TaxID=2496871 RepID=A0A3N7HWE9_9BURK|nr:PLP-dependent transferase [Albitalea terrae]RQP26708.1 Cys/Met metabolism pyridoxal-phosphate-dependent enzyme [Albitalea terrae]